MAWTRCSYCHSPAIQQCDCKQHYYCNKDHKKADWKNHINICMDIRLEAFRTQVADVIQQASLTFLEATNMMLITKIELDDQKVFAYKGVDHGNHSFVKVGDDVFPDEATKHAVLCCNAQFLPLAYMHPLFARMIRTKAVEIHEVIVKMKPAPQTVIILAEDGTETKNRPADGLALLRITSKQSEKRWYINLSGAEFGLTQSIFSANDFESNHMQALYAVFDFGKCRQYILTCSAMEGWYAHTQRIGLQASSRMKAALLNFLQQRGNDLLSLRKRSMTDMTTWAQPLVEALSRAVLGYISNYDVSGLMSQITYEPESVTRYMERRRLHYASILGDAMTNEEKENRPDVTLHLAPIEQQRKGPGEDMVVEEFESFS